MAADAAVLFPQVVIQLSGASFIFGGVEVPGREPDQ
jgi:hypothetical protein